MIALIIHIYLPIIPPIALIVWEEDLREVEELGLSTQSTMNCENLDERINFRLR
jgi:hypothetical protein